LASDKRQIRFMNGYCMKHLISIGQGEAANPLHEQLLHETFDYHWPRKSDKSAS
jgi:hypothetical protein